MVIAPHTVAGASADHQILENDRFYAYCSGTRSPLQLLGAKLWFDAHACRPAWMAAETVKQNSIVLERIYVTQIRLLLHEGALINSGV